MTLEQKYNKYIGCTTYINKKGYLIIDSKAKVIKMNHDTNGVGMFLGVIPKEKRQGLKKYHLIVQYGLANTSVYQNKFTKII